MKTNFELFPIGTKVESICAHGYFVMSACGTIEKHLGDGHAIIKTFSGHYFSTVSQHKITEVYPIN